MTSFPFAFLDTWRSFLDLEDIGDRECDIFGFYRNVRFIKLQDQKIASTKRRDKRRIKKWSKMAADFDRALTKKLPSRIYKGVPNQMRKELWLYLGLIWELWAYNESC